MRFVVLFSIFLPSLLYAAAIPHTKEESQETDLETRGVSRAMSTSYIISLLNLLIAIDIARK